MQKYVPTFDAPIWKHQWVGSDGHKIWSSSIHIERRSFGRISIDGFVSSYLSSSSSSSFLEREREFLIEVFSCTKIYFIKILPHESWTIVFFCIFLSLAAILADVSFNRHYLIVLFLNILFFCISCIIQLLKIESIWYVQTWLPKISTWFPLFFILCFIYKRFIFYKQWKQNLVELPTLHTKNKRSAIRVIIFIVHWHSSDCNFLIIA